MISDTIKHARLNEYVGMMKEDNKLILYSPKDLARLDWYTKYRYKNETHYKVHKSNRRILIITMNQGIQSFENKENIYGQREVCVRILKKILVRVLLIGNAL